MNMKRLCALLLCAVMLLTAPLEALAASGTVNTKALKLRRSASSTAKVLQTLDKGDRVEVLSATGDWYKVSYGKYTGYVMKKYLKVSGKVPEASTSTNNNANANANTGANGSIPTSTLRPGASGDKVKTLQQKLKDLGYYSGKIDGKYGNGTENAVRKYQKKKGLSADGIAGPKTLSSLFGTGNTTSTTYKTERLDWFKNGSSTIPKGAVVTVKDIKTGKTFQAKRWSGSNHADMEPLTAEDTKIMKSIYGGNWSWDRRSILVKYNGHVYSASMNGMPHGTTTISNNNFDGHFCIHFYGSKTHESNKVDPDHKNAEATAMKYTW
ncbi:MAG: peptidoglycan-binding protein [Clostridia bacterium]|nr:peptidoglycan-binding protein [Clostridia bacterium]